MKRKLKLNIQKSHRRLTIEILDIEGQFQNTQHFIFDKNRLLLWFDRSGVILNPNFDGYSLRSGTMVFDTNEERDQYKHQLIDWLRYELFDAEIGLKPGDRCFVSDGTEWLDATFVGRKPSEVEIEGQWMAVIEYTDRITCWKYVKPFIKFDGNNEIISFEI